MEHINNLYSHFTAKKRDCISMPTRKLLDLGLLKGEILDYGCGYGKDVELLKAKGFNVTGYDAYYFKDLPIRKYDTIICNYVLNVILQEEQT